MTEKKDARICIIGNGASLIDTPLGNTIDTFDVVGRINNFSLPGYEKYAGSRTDIWFNGANQKLRKRPLPSQTVVFIPSSILKRKGSAIHRRIFKRLGVSNQSRYHLVPQKEIESIEQRTRCARVTTGTAAILWAVDNYREVCIHGFDFFVDSQTHYNDPFITRFLIERGIIKKAQKHDTYREKEYVYSLAEQGRLSFLSPPPI
jgi:hypothetical protein